VLTHARRAVALAIAAGVSLLPVMVVVVDGAKRWPGA
jgi:hypothetical protein